MSRLARGARFGLEARGIVKSLGGRRVLDGVTLELAPGEIVGMLGPNGAGKTTLLRILAGTLAADAGELALVGEGARLSLTAEPLHRRARRGLGYLPQEPSAFLGLDARENLAAVLELRGRSPGAARSEAEAMLGEHGLESLARQRAGTLSGGERRRLELARLLAIEPSILLLDEPFKGLDRAAAAALGARLRVLGGEGRAVLLSEHVTAPQALELCTRIMVLLDGKVAASGSTAELAGDPVAQHALGWQ
jgi:lipopolysaccharide export system ATP-binding protein